MEKNVGPKSRVRIFRNCTCFRLRFVTATLTRTPIRFVDIRSQDSNPGMTEFEINFIHLMDKITNGSKTEINSTGTAVYYNPGFLHGGKLEHECSLQKCISYYLEPLLILAPFCKKQLQISLFGITNNDMEKTSKIKRIRGVAYSCRVSPSLCNRTVESAKGVMLGFLPDVYIQTDHRKGTSSGKSPGESVSNLPGCPDGPSVAEDVGRLAAHNLLEEIYRGGCVDSSCQAMSMIFMAFGPPDVSKMVIGPLSSYRCRSMNLFTRKFNPKRSPSRRVDGLTSSFYADLDPIELDRCFSRNNGTVRLNLGKYELVFQQGSWKIVSDQGKSAQTGQEHPRDTDIKRLKEQNYLLQLKVDLLLDMLTETTADCHLQEKQIENLQRIIQKQRV